MNTDEDLLICTCYCSVNESKFSEINKLTLYFVSFLSTSRIIPSFLIGTLNILNFHNFIWKMMSSICHNQSILRFETNHENSFAEEANFQACVSF